MNNSTQQSCRTTQDGSASRGKGFTLIDLLVVIATIAIIASILLPVFQDVQENARRASCEKNLKMIALAEIQYAQDNDGLTSGAFKRYNDDNDRTYWPELLYRYTKTKAVFLCPDASKHVDIWGMKITPTDGDQRNGTSSYNAHVRFTDYGYNCVTNGNFGVSIGTINTVGDDSESQALATVQSPATTILISETRPNPAPDGTKFGSTNTYNTNYTDYSGVFPPAGTLNSSPWSGTIGNFSDVQPRHMGGSNFLYYDGHVKWKHNSLDANGNPCDWFLTKPKAIGTFQGCK